MLLKFKKNIRITIAISIMNKEVSRKTVSFMFDMSVYGRRLD